MFAGGVLAFNRSQLQVMEGQDVLVCAFLQQPASLARPITFQLQMIAQSASGERLSLILLGPRPVIIMDTVKPLIKATPNIGTPF